MKKLLLLVLGSCCAIISAVPCCPTNVTLSPSGFCGTERMAVLICTLGQMVLTDVVLNGTKVSTLYAPNYVFVEDPDQYCLASMYKNNSDPSLGTIQVAIVCFEEIYKISDFEDISKTSDFEEMYKISDFEDISKTSDFEEMYKISDFEDISKTSDFEDISKISDFEEISKTSDFNTSGILTLISVFFLVGTIAVYTFLPQLRDLQGLCYMCMCASMALGYLFLGILQLSPGLRGEFCTVIGFLVYTCMMATFFWMNVISINVYRTVLESSYLKKTERKQYFIYSCYAWSSTLIFLTVTLIANFVEGDHWKPGFGNNSCWINGRTETWIFFYGPVAVLIAANVTLFGLTSFNLWKQTREYEDNTLNVLKHTFLLSLKLFLVMGISWIFEIASFAQGSAHIIWKIMDTFNSLQGVIIFLLLVLLRRRAMRGMANENVCLCLSRPLAERLEAALPIVQNVHCTQAQRS